MTFLLRSLEFPWLCDISIWFLFLWKRSLHFLTVGPIFSLDLIYPTLPDGLKRETTHTFSHDHVDLAERNWVPTCMRHDLVPSLPCYWTTYKPPANQNLTPNGTLPTDYCMSSMLQWVKKVTGQRERHSHREVPHSHLPVTATDTHGNGSWTHCRQRPRHRKGLNRLVSQAVLMLMKMEVTVPNVYADTPQLAKGGHLDRPIVWQVYICAYIWQIVWFLGETSPLSCSSGAISLEKKKRGATMTSRKHQGLLKLCTCDNNFQDSQRDVERSSLLGFFQLPPHTTCPRLGSPLHLLHPNA